MTSLAREKGEMRELFCQKVRKYNRFVIGDCDLSESHLFWDDATGKT